MSLSFANTDKGILNVFKKAAYLLGLDITYYNQNSKVNNPDNSQLLYRCKNAIYDEILPFLNLRKDHTIDNWKKRPKISKLILKDITETGERHTYNMTVKDNHTYFVGDIATNNSTYGHYSSVLSACQGPCPIEIIGSLPSQAGRTKYDFSTTWAWSMGISQPTIGIVTKIK
ncbi:MAG: hypothetical protein LBT10_09655 [Methanobrevibacter sp.]|nr:hypothetical protein [Methanobrevibacter sp.]